MTTTLEPGCYVVGHLGQYAGAMMIITARTLGYDEAEDIALAYRHYDAMGSSDAEPLSDDEHESLTWATDAAEEWLNENVAAEGYAFGWHDGEFYYQSIEWWNE